MVARIYKPSKTAMQSGLGRSNRWNLDYEPQTPRSSDPLMGWTSSSDMKSQVRLTFETKAEAIDYAKRARIAYRVIEASARKPVRKSYADNFKYGRIGTWTH